MRQLYNDMYQKSSGNIFCFKNKFLNFSETKQISTESFLTFLDFAIVCGYVTFKLYP